MNKHDREHFAALRSQYQDRVQQFHERLCKQYDLSTQNLSLLRYLAFHPSSLDDVTAAFLRYNMGLDVHRLPNSLSRARQPLDTPALFRDRVFACIERGMLQRTDGST